MAGDKESDLQDEKWSKPKSSSSSCTSRISKSKSEMIGHGRTEPELEVELDEIRHHVKLQVLGLRNTSVMTGSHDILVTFYII